MQPSRKTLIRDFLAVGILCGLAGCESVSDGKDKSDAAISMPDPRCVLTDTYQIEITGMGALGYFDREEEKVTLSPPTSYVHAATFLGTLGSTSCATSLSACEDPTVVDLADVKRDLEHPDVQAALASASPPSFGEEPMGDLHGYRFRRSDGAGFDVGPCVYTGCVPDGIKQLMDDMINVDDQVLETATCTGVDRRLVFPLGTWGG